MTIFTTENIIAPALSKSYLITNGTTGGYAITIKKTAGTGVAIAAGETALVYYNTVTADYVKASSISTSGIVLPANGGTGVANGTNNTITFTGNYTLGLTLTGNTTATFPTSGYHIATVTNMAANPVTGTPSSSTYLRGDGTWATISTTSGTVTSVAMTVPSFLSVSGSPITSSGTLAVTLSGTALPIANGGTGSTSTTFVNLASNVTGTLPIANGGTNSTATPTSGGVGYGTGSAHAYTSAGSSGQVLTSSGSGAPSWTTIGASGLVKISTTSITTNYQSISFSGYTRYLFVFDNLTTNVSVPNITFNSLGSGYQYGVISTGNNTYQYAASATSSVIYLTPFTLSTYQTFSGYMFLQTSNTYEAYVQYMISTSSSNGSVGNGNCATGGTTVTSIQIGGNNGTTGTVTIYGMS